MKRELEELLSWLDFGHPIYIYEWRKQKEQHDKIIETNSNTIQEKKENTHFDIKPIETEYKGYRFRSRLEARWAVFFEACGVDWEYEPEGYELGDGQRYLPDFVIHNVGIERSEDEGKLYDVYVEVKGEKPKEKDIKKFYAFSGVDSTSNEKKCPKPLLVVSKIPEDLFEQFIISHYSGNPMKEESDYLFYSMRFIKNNFNSQRTAMFFYKEGKLLIRSGDDPCYYEDIGKEDRTFTDNAFKKARSARFEFGETPDIKNEGE